MTTWYEIRQAIAKGETVYTAINCYPASTWFRKLEYISKQTGVSIDTIKYLNPEYFRNGIWLNSNFEHECAPLLLNRAGATPDPPTPDPPTPGDTSFTLANNICPLPAGTFYVSQEFGVGGHRGIDLSTSKTPGIPVYAVQAGTVALVQAWDGHTLTNNQSWGNMILINHGVTNGVTYTTRYAHLATVPSFSVGQALDKGTQLSTAGTTGNSTGIHLHLEVTANGTLVNPRNYVPI